MFQVWHYAYDYLRQYFDLEPSSQRVGERSPNSTRTYCKHSTPLSTCPTIIQISRTSRHWKLPSTNAREREREREFPAIELKPGLKLEYEVSYYWCHLQYFFSSNVKVGF